MKALIVNDKSQLRTQLKLRLNQVGFTVDEAANGSDAFAMMQSTDYDSIIPGVNVTCLNDIEFYRLVGERMPHMARRMIFCTESAGIERCMLLIVHSHIGCLQVSSVQ